MTNLPPDDSHLGLSDIVDRLCSVDDGTGVLSREHHHILPSRRVLIDMVESLRSVLFPGYYGLSELPAESVRFHVGSTLDAVRRTLQEQIKHGLSFVKDHVPNECPECTKKAISITRYFLSRLPEVRRLLTGDVEAAYTGDPSLRLPDEAILCYPGIIALTNYRLAHELYRMDVPLLPRMITEHAHSATGIDIHPGAHIGERLFIDHGTGVVIGETCVVGNRVRIYQGVTLGAKSFPLDEHGTPVKGQPRHPIVEDDVIIYGGATILGRVTIGRGATIGGNVWLTHDVAPGMKIRQAQMRLEDFSAGAGI